MKYAKNMKKDNQVLFIATDTERLIRYITDIQEYRYKLQYGIIIDCI